MFLWVYGFGCPIAGIVADRVSKRWLVIGSLAIWSVVTLATGLVNSVLMMLILRAAMGISESMYMPAAVSLTANAHLPHQRSRAVAILTTAQIVGTFAGGSFGGWMAGLGHWRLRSLHWAVLGCCTLCRIGCSCGRLMKQLLGPPDRVPKGASRNNQQRSNVP